MFEVDWSAHLTELNQRYRLADQNQLRHPGDSVPPVLFIGDVEAVRPHEWVFIISLNPQVDDSDWRLQERQNPDVNWRLTTEGFKNWWYPRFFGPFARVAAAALGLDAAGRERQFARDHIVFGELIPYSSRKFSLPWHTVSELTRNDRGVLAAAKVNQILIEEASPALVLVNGNAAKDVFDEEFGGHVDWEERKYSSPSKEDKTLRHFEGLYDGGGVEIPIAGFPFVRSRGSFNSNPEVDELGRRLRQFVLNHNQIRSNN